MPTPLDHLIRARIDAFLEEVTILVRRRAVETVQLVLGDGRATPAGDGLAAPAQGGRPVRRGPAGRKPGRLAVAAVKPRPPAKEPNRERAKPDNGRRHPLTSDDVAELGARIWEFISANPGCGLGTISKALRRSTPELKRPMILLVASGNIRSEGERGATRYFTGKK